MNQAQTLVQALKRLLKSQGVTYRTLAAELGISEASVKRNFSTQSFTLNRLIQICQIGGIEFADLAKQMDIDTRTLTEFSEVQEREIVSDQGLLLVAFLVVNGWQYQDIFDHYTFPKHELIRYLAKLDRLKLIELLRNNRIRLLIASNFAWRKNGPIQAFFSKHLQQEFLNSQFDQENECLIFLTAMLSPVSLTLMQKRLLEVIREFNRLNEEDKRVSFDRKQTSSILLGLRPWKPIAFRKYLRAV